MLAWFIFTFSGTNFCLIRFGPEPVSSMKVMRVSMLIRTVGRRLWTSKFTVTGCGFRVRLFTVLFGTLMGAASFRIPVVRPVSRGRWSFPDYFLDGVYCWLSLTGNPPADALAPCSGKRDLLSALVDSFWIGNLYLNVRSYCKPDMEFLFFDFASSAGHFVFSNNC